MSKLLVNAVTDRTEGPELPGHMVSPAHPLLILQVLGQDCGNSVHHKLIRRQTNSAISSLPSHKAHKLIKNGMRRRGGNIFEDLYQFFLFCNTKFIKQTIRPRRLGLETLEVMEVRLKDTRSHGGQAQRHQRSWKLGLETLEVMEFRLRDTIGHAWRLDFETREVIKVRLRDTRGHVGQAQRHQRPWKKG